MSSVKNGEDCMKLTISRLGYITQHSLLFLHIFAVAGSTVFFHKIVVADT